ncbi:transposase [Sorangium sp. So ce117]|uniref:transposase n=1 Tax=Sorangium sp. So ce117 TaxID=3133277 RepID=UPI003F5DD4CF
MVIDDVPIADRTGFMNRTSPIFRGRREGLSSVRPGPDRAETSLARSPAAGRARGASIAGAASPRLRGGRAATRTGESDPSKFAVTTLGTKMSKKQIVRQYKERYRTEQAYEEMKGELGLDHFEGRRFRGWHHHVSVVLCCYAFIVAERDRSFFPSADAEGHAHPLRFAA